MFSSLNRYSRSLNPMRDCRDDSIYNRFKLGIDSQHKTEEVGQACGLEDTGASNEENFATRVRKKEALGNSRQARTQWDLSIACAPIPN